MTASHIEIEHNSFISLLTDSVKNYHLLLENEKSNSNFIETLSKGCIFNSNFALQAAANTFISMTDLSPKLLSKVERFPTIDKFDLVLSLFLDSTLPRSEQRVQEIQALIKIRNKLVHPKKHTQPTKIYTEKGRGEISKFHSQPEAQEKLSNLSQASENFASLSYDANIAELAIKATIHFLNWYVSDLWEIDTGILEEHIFPYFIDETERRPMHSIEEIRFLMDYQDTFKIEFLNIESINALINKTLYS